MKPKITVSMTFERATKNTFLFSRDTERHPDTPVASVYISKKAFPHNIAPSAIVLHVEYED